ncbi:MAG TPA: hypothetical protein PLZ74_05895 [Kiritimatiellia bacterium]|nr:hypothetical protein [Kiritimatiellia bacterium]
MTTNNREALNGCLDQITSLSPAESLEPLGERIIDLLWSVSEARSDLDALPIIISEHEVSLRLSCQNGNAQQAGQSVCAVFNKIARCTPSQVREGLRSACGVIDDAFKTKTPTAIAEGLRDAVRALVDERQTGGTLPVFVEGDGIRIGRHFKVTFCRTLRVPDDGKNYPLPAGLGHFPIHAVADYAQRVPREWLETGGFFLPMYQSEAMYLELGGQTWRPNIAKVGVGRINAVTGKPWDERIHATEQDYVLCPQQKWLDGINAGQGFVRQFVAMPLGKGYTVEEQVTDECQFGGIQIAAFAAKPGIFPEIDPQEIENAKLKPGDADLMAGILKLVHPYQSVLAMQVLKYSPKEILDALGNDKRDLLKVIQKDALAQLEPLIKNKDAFSRLKNEIFPSDIRYSLSAGQPRYRLAGISLDELYTEPSMGMAAGGRLKQKIIGDTFGANTWDPLTKGSVFIHLVNSNVYRDITGNAPPTRPIEAVHYQSMGIPWFSYYDDRQTSLAPSRILSRIKSIFTVDQQRGKAEKPETPLPVDSQKIVEIKIPSRMERVHSLLSATQAAVRNGAPKSVVRLTTSILDLKDDFAPAISLRAEAHLLLGFYDEAKCDADHALKLSTDKEISMAARCVRAKVALLTGAPEMALLEAKAAIRVSGNDPTLAKIIEEANAILSSR